MQELKFLKELQKRTPVKKGVIKGIGDDTAVLPFSREKYLLYASDMIVEGVHFQKSDPPEKIGYKAVAVNISDIAAMGGIPKYITVSAGVPKNKSFEYRNKIFKGIQKICRSFDVAVVGGDTCASDRLVVDVSIIGQADKKKIVYRDGAKVGDNVFVTGALGAGRQKHLSFLPRLKESKILVGKFKINAMMDISDGLFMDMYRICQASKKGCLLYKDKIPVSKKARSFEDACTYGEDFELLFTLNHAETKKLEKYVIKNNDMKVYNIGRITQKKTLLCMQEEKGKQEKIKVKGFSHIKNNGKA